MKVKTWWKENWTGQKVIVRVGIDSRGMEKTVIHLFPIEDAREAITKPMGVRNSTGGVGLLVEDEANSAS